jgi:hypothetical protein
LFQADLDGKCGVLVQAKERNAIQGKLAQDLLELAVRIMPKDEAAVLVLELFAECVSDAFSIHRASYQRRVTG